jgi:hypothetical protein
MNKIEQTAVFLGDRIGVYFSEYMNWLTIKLQGQSSFGTLSLTVFLALFLALIYVFIRNSRDF